MSSEPLLWDLSETARQLGGISTRTVRRMLDRGELTAHRLGRRLMIRADSVRGYLDLCTPSLHNSGHAGKAVLPLEDSTCRKSVNAIKTGSSPARIRRTGGRATRMEAANRLADLLGFDRTKIPTR
jgi:excisionase family DNA binding protein